MSKLKKGLLIIIALIVGLMTLGMITIYIQNSKPQMELGLVNGVFQEIPNKDNSVSTQTVFDEKRIEPIAFRNDLKTAVIAMKKTLEAYGGIEITEEKENYIYAVATTGTMKFHDDIEIYFDEDEGLIHYRSASRAGYSDMGLNRQRFEALKALYLGN